MIIMSTLLIRNNSPRLEGPKTLVKMPEVPNTVTYMVQYEGASYEFAIHIGRRISLRSHRDHVVNVGNDAATQIRPDMNFLYIYSYLTFLS